MMQARKPVRDVLAVQVLGLQQSLRRRGFVVRGKHCAPAWRPDLDSIYIQLWVLVVGRIAFREFKAMLRVIAILGWVGVTLLGCVEAEPDDPLGTAHFYSSASRPFGTDYGPPAAPASGGTNAGAAGAAGADQPIGGMGAAAMPAPNVTAGAGAAPMASGTGGGGAGGGAGTAPEQPIAGTDSAPTAGSEAPAEAGTGGTAEPRPDAPPGTLMVSVTTAAGGGRYAPRNCGAIWIETASGEFVKTIERWAAIRVGDLRAWNQASGGWGFSLFGSSTSPDAVDAVTAATLTRHQPHSPTWSFKDASGAVVPDGTYKVKMEVADGRSVVSEVTFTKGPEPETVSAPAGGQGYTSFTVTYAP
jgi:hypothetical protein